MKKKFYSVPDPDIQDAVNYARYSSHSQRDCSIEQQVADCELFAQQNGLRVVKIYADRHLSGTTDNRPQFQQMLKDAAHGHWPFVICWKIDRFARNRYDSATYKYKLKKAGVRVLYAKESIPDGPEGILLESVLEGSAEYYSASLAQNIRRGMRFNYYGCQKRRRERACKKANVPREWIEKVVVKAALDYVLQPDVMEWITDAVMEYQEREAASSQLAALTAELEENQKATDNVMKAIEAGIITATTKQRLLDLETKAKDLKRAIELEKLSHVRLEREQILYWLEQFQGGSLQSQEFRRKVIDTFVSVIYLSDDHLRIAFNYSGQNRSEADFNLIMDAETASADYPTNSFSLPLCPPHKKNPNLFPLGKRFGFFRLPYFLPRHFHFQSQQRGFFIDAACISGQAAVCSDNAVAGNDDRDHIVSDSPAHSLRRHPGKAALCG